MRKEQKRLQAEIKAEKAELDRENRALQSADVDELRRAIGGAADADGDDDEEDWD